MAIRTFGHIEIDKKMENILITSCEPHVSIKLKNIFPKIPKVKIPPYKFQFTPENCADLMWFMERYPLSIDESHLQLLKSGQRNYNTTRANLDRIMMPDYIPENIELLKPGFTPRNYQLTAAEIIDLQQRILLGDEVGLGKTWTAILTMKNPEKRPVLIVVQTHLPIQWKVDFIEKITNLSVHIIKGTKPYSLTQIKAKKKVKGLFGDEEVGIVEKPADVYIINYSCLAKWVNVIESGFFKTVIFDEVQ